MDSGRRYRAKVAPRRRGDPYDAHLWTETHFKAIEQTTQGRHVFVVFTIRAFGERAGRQVRRIGSGFGYEGDSPTLSGPRCASVHGFSLHANTHIPAHRRDQLERLIRYTARGAVSLERLAQDEGGDLLYTFTRAWSDGTRGITLSPLELLEKLAALVPPPRAHQVRYSGWLAAHSKLRSAISPTSCQQGLKAAASPASSRWGWARLLKRVFAIDRERCPRCPSGTLRIIAAIPSRSVIRRILCHLKLATAPQRLLRRV